MKHYLLTALSLFIALATLADDRRDWEDAGVQQRNREPARAAFFPFIQNPGDRQLSLDGMWRFHWTPTPDTQPDNFFQTDFDDSQWVFFPVPADWEMNGYGTPIYSSSGYTFKIDPPRVMGKPKSVTQRVSTDALLPFPTSGRTRRSTSALAPSAVLSIFG